MESWRDQGIVLSVKPHGENGGVVSVLTESNGRHAGYVRGISSSKMRGLLERGNLVSIEWSARSTDDLGSFKIEQDRHISAGLMGDKLKLSALLSACSLCDRALPERERHTGIFHGLLALLDTMDMEGWGVIYVMWELALLRELGFAIDITRCAAGGDASELAYISPKSGRAVSEAAAAPYKEKLLPLPAFLKPDKGDVNDEEVLTGLRLTGYFLKNWVFAQHTQGIPEDRLRFEERFAKTVDQNSFAQDKDVYEMSWSDVHEDELENDLVDIDG
jgi:DNA repair protein RecO (recombination protein O)